MGLRAATLAGVAWALTGIWTTAAAQTVPVPQVAETVIVTAGTLPVSFSELPRSVRVITRDDLERLPVASTADLVRLLASVDVRARGPRGVQADFGARGSSFGQVLVLVDGRRMNNAQTGHHNSDLTVTLDDIDRVEVLLGPGSSAFGADAFGGTINLITRRGASRPQARLVLGQHGLVEAGGAVGARAGAVEQRLSGQVSRADGFMDGRDFRTVILSSRTDLGSRTALTAGFVDKAFGAHGFYGPAPSREWTRQWTAALDRTLTTRDTLTVVATASYRQHRDRFLWDERRPGVFESTHRTDAADVVLRARWAASSATDVGLAAEAGGDTIRSSSLGGHTDGHGGLAVDVQHRLGEATVVQAAVRGDAYSTFGATASPSLGLSHWLAPAWRLRVSAGRAFRVPTFTERYYRDPLHQASESLSPERAWAADAAIDWLSSPAWQGTAGVFRRWERDVIDWVRPGPSAVWRTANIRDVLVTGIEAGVRRPLAGGTSLSFDYTWQTVAADPLALQSKYTLDYARHSAVAAVTAGLPGGMQAGGRVDGRWRTGRDPYALVDLRVSRAAGGARVFVEASNVFDVAYEEVRGVPMPGRWVLVGVELAR